MRTPTKDIVKIISKILRDERKHSVSPVIDNPSFSRWT